MVIIFDLNWWYIFCVQYVAVLLLSNSHGVAIANFAECMGVEFPFLCDYSVNWGLVK